jgi:hypothetical protein
VTMHCWWRLRLHDWQFSAYSNGGDYEWALYECTRCSLTKYISARGR